MTDTVLRPPHRIRARLGKVSYTYNLMAGQRVVEEGEDGLPLFVVTAGALAASITSNGERVIVGILGPGDVFGDTRLVPDAPPHPEAQALTRARLLAIGPGSLRRLIDVDESVRGWLLATVLLRVRTYEHHVAALLPRGVAGRVEVVLQDLAGRFGRPWPVGRWSGSRSRKARWPPWWARAGRP